MLSRSLVLKVTSWGWMERLVKKSFLFRPMVKRFVAGNTLGEALDICSALSSRGFLLSLDLLGENVKSVDEAITAKNTYIDMLGAIDAKGLNPLPRDGSCMTEEVGGGRQASSSTPQPPSSDTNIPRRGASERTNISIKLTQCGFDQGDELAERHYREVLAEANKRGNFVRVDMEDSRYTERTVSMIERVWPDFKNTGTVLQTYLYRTPKDMDRMIALGARIRIVKGAYAEPKEIAYPSKKDVDRVYVELAKRALKEVNYPAIATHNERILEEIKAFVSAEGIDRASFEFQMIYGVRRDLQEKLRAEGYNMRIYVPFGEAWYPYFTRRLAERPANFFFLFKSLFKG